MKNKNELMLDLIFKKIDILSDIDLDLLNVDDFINDFPCFNNCIPKDSKYIKYSRIILNAMEKYDRLYFDFMLKNDINRIDLSLFWDNNNVENERNWRLEHMLVSKYYIKYFSSLDVNLILSEANSKFTKEVIKEFGKDVRNQIISNMDVWIKSIISSERPISDFVKVFYENIENEKYRAYFLTLQYNLMFEFLKLFIAELFTSMYSKVFVKFLHTFEANVKAEEKRLNVIMEKLRYEDNCFFQIEEIAKTLNTNTTKVTTELTKDVLSNYRKCYYMRMYVFFNSTGRHSHIEFTLSEYGDVLIQNGTINNYNFNHVRINSVENLTDIMNLFNEMFTEGINYLSEDSPIMESLLYKFQTLIRMFRVQ